MGSFTRMTEEKIESSRRVQKCKQEANSIIMPKLIGRSRSVAGHLSSIPLIVLGFARREEDSAGFEMMERARGHDIGPVYVMGLKD